MSVYRFNYYPTSSNGQQNKIGFGAHRDITTITFLFSNDSDGFQVSEQCRKLSALCFDEYVESPLSNAML